MYLFVLLFEKLPKWISFSSKALHQETKRECFYLALAERYLKKNPLSVICWKVKSKFAGWFNLWQQNSCLLFPPRRKFKSTSKSITPGVCSLKLEALSWTRKRGLDCVTNQWLENVLCHLVSAGRCLADMALREWRFQSPLKWNYGALHSSVAFECFQQYAMKGT